MEEIIISEQTIYQSRYLAHFQSLGRPEKKSIENFRCGTMNLVSGKYYF